MSNASDFIIENGVLKKYVGPGGDVVIPEGVTAIEPYVFDYRKDVKSITLPKSLTKIHRGAFIGCKSLTEIIIDPDHPSMVMHDEVLYDRKMTTLLLYPTGSPRTEYKIPEGITTVYMGSVPSREDFHLYVPGTVLDMDYGYGGCITIHAPAGSFAERFARRKFDNSCRFIEEGEPVCPDESAQRKERALKEWRDYFTFSTRSKGIHISAYHRGSKTVYLPDIMGKTEVASISKDAFPPDVTILCSKKMFTKLFADNRHATIHSFLVDRDLFTEEEQNYLLAYLKKYRDIYLEKYIHNEDYPALEACCAAMPKVKTLMDECLAITERLEKQHVNLFLMQCSQK